MRSRCEICGEERCAIAGTKAGWGCKGIGKVWKWVVVVELMQVAGYESV